MLSSRSTVWTWLDRWLADCVKPKVRLTTYQKYESTLRCYIKPVLGSKLITKLKAPEMQRVFNNLVTTGGNDRKGISTSTVRAARRYLSMAFSKGVEVGVVKKNIVKATEPPGLVKDDIHPLTEQQAENLLKVAKEGEYIYVGTKQRQKTNSANDYLINLSHLAVTVALGPGMRLGEVFGLQWSDIDFEQDTIRIERTLACTSKGIVFQDPKTKGSKRRIPITKKLKKALEHYQKEQVWFGNLLGDKYNNEKKLVFCNAKGKPMDVTNFLTR